MSRHEFADDDVCRLCGAEQADAADDVGCDVELQNPDAYLGFALTQAEQAQLDGRTTEAALDDKRNRIQAGEPDLPADELVRRRREFEVGASDSNH